MSPLLLVYITVAVALLFAGVVGLIIFRGQVKDGGERLILVLMVLLSAFAWPITVPISFAIVFSQPGGTS